jgi:hypothetical protein
VHISTIYSRYAEVAAEQHVWNIFHVSLFFVSYYSEYEFADGDQRSDHDAVQYQNHIQILPMITDVAACRLL